MSKLDELAAEFESRGRKVTFLYDGVRLEADGFRIEPDATSVFYHYSRTTGGGFAWGSQFQYGAPDTATPAFLADMIEETLT